MTGTLNPISTEVFLRCAISMGTEAALDLAEVVGRSHPSDRLRLASFEAREGLLDDVGEREALWREAEVSGSRLLAGEAAIRRAALAA